jgi:RND family efflux transporter MFP subunit
MFRLTLILLLAVLVGCSDTPSADVKPQLRGLKTVVVADRQNQTSRQFPSVLQPSSSTVLSFETGGTLQVLTLAVGQSVEAGAILAELDTTLLELDVASAHETLEQARTAAANAEADFARKAPLAEEGFVSESELDASFSAAQSSRSQVTQAQKTLETAKQKVERATLIAPFDGVIGAVEVDSYATVAAGSPIASLYSDASFETAFSVNFDVVNRLIVGKEAIVTLADRPEIQLRAAVSELGSRADTISSFPVVITLTESHPMLKAGMAVAVGLEFAVSEGEGYALPLHVLALKNLPESGATPLSPPDATIFVFDKATSTVRAQVVKIGGISKNDVIVIGGIKPGDRVASAGVSFLRDGQQVKLIDDDSLDDAKKR